LWLGEGRESQDARLQKPKRGVGKSAEKPRARPYIRRQIEQKDHGVDGYIFGEKRPGSAWGRWDNKETERGKAPTGNDLGWGEVQRKRWDHWGRQKAEMAKERWGCCVKILNFWSLQERGDGG